jgi:mannose-6-phosphate isomerase-like protein (cupin superfamily)
MMDEVRYPWATKSLSAEPDGRALDGCEVRLLTCTPFSSAIHCELEAGAVSQVTVNNWIHEIWFIISGQGHLWRSNGKLAQQVPVEPGTTITIPPQVAFQYRSSQGEKPLVFLCFGAPSFPGPEANELSAEPGGLGAPTVRPGTGAGPGRVPASS